MQCDFTQAELTMLDMAIIVRTADAEVALEEYRQREKVNPASVKVLEASVARLEALHAKLSRLIEESKGEEQ